MVQKYEYRLRACRKYGGQNVSWKLRNSTQHCSLTNWIPRMLYLLPCTQQPSTCLIHEPDESFLCPSISFLLKSISIPPSHVRICLSSRSIHFRFPRQNPLCTSILPHACHWPFHLTLLDFITLVIFGEDFRPFDIMIHSADRIFKVLPCGPCWHCHLQKS